MVFIAVACMTLLFAVEAAACPNCAIGQQARNQVLSEDFGANLVVAVLPFLIIVAVCLRVERIGTASKSRRASTSRHAEIAQ
jgi:hypothetical protein